MTSALSASLKSLHELLRQLVEAQGRKADGPREVALADKQVAAGEQLIEQQKATIKAARKAADEQNLKLKSKEADLAKLQGQLNAASSNKEFDIFKGQLAAAQKDKGNIEDAALTSMDAIDTANKKLKELEADLQKRKQTAKLARSTVDEQLPVLAAAIETLETQLADAEKAIPAGEPLTTYRRLRMAHGATALAEVEDNFCSFCNSRVTAQDMVRMRMSEFMFCRGCGRVLYIS